MAGRVLGVEMAEPVRARRLTDEEGRRPVANHPGRVPPDRARDGAWRREDVVMGAHAGLAVRAAAAAALVSAGLAGCTAATSGQAPGPPGSSRDASGPASGT